MTTTMHLVILLEQACQRAAHADPGLAARHQRIAMALIEAIKRKAAGGKPAAATGT